MALFQFDRSKCRTKFYYHKLTFAILIVCLEKVSNLMPLIRPIINGAMILCTKKFDFYWITWENSGFLIVHIFFISFQGFIVNLMVIHNSSISCPMRKLPSIQPVFEIWQFLFRSNGMRHLFRSRHTQNRTQTNERWIMQQQQQLKCSVRTWEIKTNQMSMYFMDFFFALRFACVDCVVFFFVGSSSECQCVAY